MAASASGRPWHVVLVVGDTADAVTAPPANVEVHAEVPQLAVLHHADAFITHAGMGSTMEALAAGVPLVAVPQMAEQRANADRIAALGLGSALDPDRLETEALWRAVEHAADDPAIHTRLRWMRAEIEAAGGAAAAADAVEVVLRDGAPGRPGSRRADRPVGPGSQNGGSSGRP